MIIFMVILSQFFWVFRYESTTVNNGVLNIIFYNLELVYALAYLGISNFTIYLFYTPNSAINSMEY